MISDACLGAASVGSCAGVLSFCPERRRWPAGDLRPDLDDDDLRVTFLLGDDCCDFWSFFFLSPSSRTGRIGDWFKRALLKLKPGFTFELPDFSIERLGLDPWPLSSMWPSAAFFGLDFDLDFGMFILD